MEIKLNTFDRAIIHYLTNKEANLFELRDNFKVDLEVLNNVIQKLVSLNIIIINENKLSINKHLSKDQIKSVNNRDAKFVEYSYIVKKTISQSLQEKAKMQVKKFSLSSTDYAILQSMLKNIESFIKENNQSKSNIESTKVFFWGENNYENIYTNLA